MEAAVARELGAWKGRGRGSRGVQSGGVSGAEGRAVGTVVHLALAMAAIGEAAEGKEVAR